MRRGRIFGAVMGILTALVFAGSVNAANAPLPNSALDASVQGYGGVDVVTIRPSTQVAGVAGAQHTVKHVTCAELAARGGTQSAAYRRMCSSASGRLGAVHSAAALPFTGLQLTIAVMLGAALLAGGFLLRRVAGERPRA